MKVYQVKTRSVDTGRWVVRCEHPTLPTARECDTLRECYTRGVDCRIIEVVYAEVNHPFVDWATYTEINGPSGIPFRAWTPKGLAVREAAIRFVGLPPAFSGARRDGSVYLKWPVGSGPTVKGTGAKFPADEVGLSVFRDWLLEQGYEVKTNRGEGQLKSETVTYVWVYVQA